MFDRYAQIAAAHETSASWILAEVFCEIELPAGQ